LANRDGTDGRKRQAKTFKGKKGGGMEEPVIPLTEEEKRNQEESKRMRDKVL
jgi:hypothetical protein